MGCWSEVPRYCHYDLNIRCIYVGMQSHKIKSIDVVNSSGNCIYGDVRLVGGSNQHEGSVQLLSAIVKGHNI